MRRALISTLVPGPGGVSAMLQMTLRLLEERGLESTVAWYEPYSYSPQLSVPSFRLGTRRVGAEARRVEGTRGAMALGAWLPELEFTHYWPTRRWRELIAGHDLHLVVSGNCLPGFPFARTGTPFLAWVASDWHGDRKDRVAKFPPLRRWLDRLVTRPAMRRIEPAILRRGRILALSQRTRRELDRVACAAVSKAVLPCPVDLDGLGVELGSVVPGRIGLVGRFDDPRKNVELFLSSVARARELGVDIEAVLVGSEPGSVISAAVERAGLSGHALVLGHVGRRQFVDELKKLDVLVVSSHQEGLGIAALEAMACGCPVVTTRCGGPEEFVRNGENGFLASADADEIAGRIALIVRDRPLRDRLGAAARSTVETHYAWAGIREIFERELMAFDRSSSFRNPGFES